MWARATLCPGGMYRCAVRTETEAIQVCLWLTQQARAYDEYWQLSEEGGQWGQLAIIDMLILLLTQAGGLLEGICEMKMLSLAKWISSSSIRTSLLEDSRNSTLLLLVLLPLANFPFFLGLVENSPTSFHTNENGWKSPKCPLGSRPLRDQWEAAFII